MTSIIKISDEDLAKAAPAGIQGRLHPRPRCQMSANDRVIGWPLLLGREPDNQPVARIGLQG